MTMLRERVGEAVGWLSAPLFGLTSSVRRARTLHPEGIVLNAAVGPIEDGEPSLRALGERLRGPALVRFSNALWKGEREWRDVLGCAIRFRRDEAELESADGEQDILFATIRSPWSMALAPFATHVHDFLGNRYFGSAPFDAPGLGRVKFRLTPERESSPQGRRRDRLLTMVARGEATLLLEARPTWTTRYDPVARVTLQSTADVDPRALRFDPFRTGLGIEPRGFVHALRRGAYSGSQRGRPAPVAARRTAS